MCTGGIERSDRQCTRDAPKKCINVVFVRCIIDGAVGDIKKEEFGLTCEAVNGTGPAYRQALVKPHAPA